VKIEDKKLEDEVIEVSEELAPVEQVQEQEQKLLSQDKVNDIVKRVRMEERNKIQRDYGVDLERLKADKLSASQRQESSQEQNAPRDSNNEDVVGRQIEERLLRMANEHKLKVEQEAEQSRLQSIADTYYKKMEEGSELFEDFDDVMKDFNPSKNADIIELAHEFDNLPQIMYELANNRTKASELRRLARDDREDAMYELQRLSKSIMHNEKAQQDYSPARAPLTKHKASNVGADNGTMNLKDFKNASWLKG
jgi:hypothetical protein